MRLDTAGIIVTCSSCGKSNRLAFSSLNHAARCANCKTRLPAPGAPIEVAHGALFDAASTHSALPLIVDFWAPWCGPCRMVAPELERVARENAGRYLVIKVNTDVVTDVAARFRIRSIPTLAVVFGGRELARLTGVQPASEIEAFVARTLADATSRAS